MNKELLACTLAFKEWEKRYGEMSVGDTIKFQLIWMQGATWAAAEARRIALEEIDKVGT